MTQEEIENYNRLCAEFLGAYFCNDDLTAYPNGYWIIDDDEIDLPYNLEDMDFHSDWNWIMEVVEAIENKGFDVFINTCVCRITDVGEDRFEDIETFVNNNKKEAVVQAINKFLIWYNNENNTN